MQSLGHFYFLFLISTGSHVDADLKKYVPLISDVHKFYGTSSVFFISSSNDRREYLYVKLYLCASGTSV